MVDLRTHTKIKYRKDLHFYVHETFNFIYIAPNASRSYLVELSRSGPDHTLYNINIKPETRQPNISIPYL